MLMHAVKDLSDTYQVITGQSPLGIIQLPEVLDENGYQLQPQASAYPGPLSYNNYWTGTQPAGGKFDGDLDCYEPITTVDHSASRAQARRAYTQSIEARKAINRNASYTVGRGLFVKSTPNPEITGLTPEQADELGKKITVLFDLWAKSKSSDKTGDNNFYQNQRFAQIQKKRDGEAFPWFTYSDDPTLINPLRIDFIDPNQIRGDEYTLSLGPESQDVGIIYKDGEKFQYKVWVTDLDKPGSFKDKTVPAKDPDTGLPVMLHMFDKKNAGQQRGITELITAISDLEKITGYKTATFDRMQSSATYTFWIGNDLQTPSNMDVSSVNAISAGTEYTSESCQPITAQADWKYNTMGGSSYQTGQRKTAVIIDGGQKGDKLNTVEEAAPSETSAEFVKYNSEAINAALNMSSEVVDMKFTTSYTSAQAALGAQNKESNIERDDLDADLITQAFFAVVSGFVASGLLKLPGFSDPIMRAGYLEKRLTHDPPIVLRPDQEAKATLENIILGRETFEDAAERLNNSNFASNAAANVKGVEKLFSQIGTPKIDPDADDNEEKDPDNNNDNGDN